MRSYLFKKLSVAALLLLGMSRGSYAQFEEGKELVTVTKITGAALATTTPSATQTYAPDAYENQPQKKIKNIIWFKIDENSTTFFASGFQATVNFNIESKVTLASSTVTTSKSLTVNFDNTAGATYKPIAYLELPVAEYVKVIVTSPVSITGHSGWDPTPILELSNEMRVIRYYDLSTNPTLLTPTFGTAVNNTDNLAVSWTWPAGSNNNMSQLEWSWVEDEMAAFYPNTTKLLEDNSTRVDLDAGINTFKIPLLYNGTGKLYYRVRAALRKNSGQVISGAWHEAPSYFSFAGGHEPGLNWQSSTSFAENGKLKTVIQYFDGSMRGRQTVTKDNSTNNTVVGETIYDLQGRPNIQILPTPTDDNTIQYFSNFNRFIGQGLNEDPSRYFDLTPEAVQCNRAMALDSNYGNAKYYSNQNPWLSLESKSSFIPDAKGYAFTETRFMDDATGRIRSQGGVGLDHQIGSGHETRYFYGKPSQPELDALFATEVGFASHYSKNMVQDANGQMSVSYVDMHGRIIATALAGNPTPGIDSIINETDYPLAAGLVKNDLTTADNNIIQGQTIESISSILVPAYNEYKFTYQLDPAILSQFACNAQQICFDCKYDLEISIKGEGCGDTTPIIRRYQNLQAVPANQACSTSMGFKGPGADTLLKKILFTENLQPGSYIIRKTLTINDSLFQLRRDSALKVFLCRTQQDIEDSILTIMTIASGCNIPAANAANCTSCLTNLGFYSAYRGKYLTNIGVDTLNTDYDELIAALYTQDSLDCVMACATAPIANTLYGLRLRMLNDMIPDSGQYALTTTLPATDLQNKYNIFSTAYPAGYPTWSFTKPFYKYPVTENGTASFYKEEDGIFSGSVYPLGSGDADFLQALDKPGFNNLFQRQWAEELIKYHPEFVKLQLAEGNLKTSYEWMDRVQACESYAAAAAWGFTNPMSNDPYFVLGYGSADNSTMTTYLTSHIGTNAAYHSIWQMANGMALCKGLPENLRGDCISGKNDTGIQAGITDSLVKNEIWENFKTLYFSYRNEMVTEYINANTASQLSQANMDQLQSEGKKLHFTTAQDLADQNGIGGSWANTLLGDTTGSAFPGPPGTTGFGSSSSKCAVQRVFWKQRLLQCDTLMTLLNSANPADTAAANDIISEILDGLEQVCLNSIDAQNPNGASTVNPAIGGTPGSFEEVINNVFTLHGIVTPPVQYYCNPYSVDNPKPYGTNPPVAINNTNVLDSCACTQYIKYKQEAHAQSYDTLSMSSMNEFFLYNYGDTLNSVLWEGFQKCDTSFRDTCTWVKTELSGPIFESLEMIGGGKECPDPVVTDVQHVISGGVQYLEVFYQTNSYCDTDTLQIRDTTGAFIVNMAIPCGTGSILVALAHCNDYLVRILTNSENCDTQWSAYFELLRPRSCTCLLPSIDSLSFVTPYPTDSTQNIQVHYDVPAGLSNCKLKVLVDYGSGPVPYSTQSISCSGSPVTVNLPACQKYLFYIESFNAEWDTYCDSLAISDTMTLNSCWQQVCVPLFTPVILSEPVAVPVMFRCGYVKPCITCDTLKSYVQQFRVIYPAFAAVPYMSPDATTEQTEQNSLLARFINFRTGFSKNAIDYLTAWRFCGLDSCSGEGSAPDHLVLNTRAYPYPDSYIARIDIEMNPGFESLTDDYFIAEINDLLDTCSTAKPGNTIAICNSMQATNDPAGIFVPDPNPCEDVQTQAGIIALQLYQQMKDSLIAKFDSLYLAKCLEAKYTEQFYVEYKPKEYHYTLYYYDQAGNLVKTLPPAAVKPNYNAGYLAGIVTARNNGTDSYASQHNNALATHYRYNTLNQVIAQKTPDAGTSRFWYDRLGRLVVSQNAKQEEEVKYSYTLYDGLGRITQVGQKPQSTPMTDGISRNESSLADWLKNDGASINAQNKEQITRTVYDVSYFNGDDILGPLGDDIVLQKNLRNRVSYTQVFDTEPTGTEADINRYAGTHLAATHYSYDIHGNVDVLVQDFREGVMAERSNRFKKIQYSYDLISGKVNAVAYQPGAPDQFYHRYQYDAENRLTEVYTSFDKIYWERDAQYDYYRHGPLFRTILGQNQVQGVDYAYTIQGWLKGINSTVVSDGSFDMSGDGRIGQPNVHVGRDVFGMSLNYFSDDYKSISNSAIPFAAVSGLSGTGAPLYNGNISSMLIALPQLHQDRLYGFRYDQLNRLVKMNLYEGLNTGTNSFTPVSLGNEFREELSYDPNGNIKTYLRYKETTLLNNYTYNYTSNTNRLASIHNAVTSGTSGYAYDNIGNVVEDNKLGMENGVWNLYGKLQSAENADGTINYTYDAAGLRISKSATEKEEWYVRDATGNIMATYVTDPAINDNELTLTERYKYGSSLLSINRKTANVENGEEEDFVSFERGNDWYILTDHLGNTRAEITDKKIQHSALGVTVDYYTADQVSAYYYSAYGAISKSMGTDPVNAFNGQRKSPELGPHAQTAQFWEYNGDVGRRWNVDPRPIMGLSPYLVFQGNPNFFSDSRGDTVINGTKHEASSPSAATYLEPVFVFAQKRFVPYPYRINVEPSSGNNNIAEVFTWRLDQNNQRQLDYYNRTTSTSIEVKPDDIDRQMSEAIINGNPGSNLIKNIGGAIDVIDAAKGLQKMGNGQKLNFSSVPLPYGIDIVLSAADDYMEPLERDLMKYHFNQGYTDYIQFYHTTEIGKKSTLLNVYVTDDMLKQVQEKGYYCMNEAGHGYRGVAWNHPYSPAGEKYTHIITFDEPESKYDAKIKVFGVLKIDLK
jgi:YD repeat-containing protein